MKLRKPRTSLLLRKITPENTKVTSEFYVNRAKSRGLSLAEMRDITSRVKQGYMSKAEAKEILKHEKSKFIKWRIKKALEKAEKRKSL